ncbi:hypothetical protein MFIFM68171_06882 [Madurella fahalii]|uniref:Uncharacterized protein n=1 Tax=Madurella fahalii TaxID=1157608 RepID=A0ABQ0GFX8_9PEZI
MSFSWFSSILCCGADEKPRPSVERNIIVLRDQPAVIPRPSAEPLWTSERTYEKTFAQERERSRLRKSNRDSSSTRKQWFRSSSSTRRLQISGPTDFRHVHSESFQLPPERSRPRSFRPIELSIYQPDNRLSPILPYLDGDDDLITPPPRAHTANSSRWDASSGTTLTNDRGYSAMSFHIPRRHARQGSGVSDASQSPPRIPPKSRARANTAPSTERIVERIASALVEKERLQAEINSLIERQSIFFSSRPSTGYDMRGFAPMPSIPALPAAAPSFAERLSVDDRPRTAPSHMGSMTIQEKTLELATAAFQSQPPQTPRTYSPSDRAHFDEQDDLDRPLAPPLPLILRPPLRKKKSFSRVSSWLFNPDDQQQNPHGHGHNEESTDSSPTYFTANGTVVSRTATATTNPRPLKESDGFYQCVAPPEGLPRTSMETSSSVYTWETNEDGEARTVPTTMTTAASSPRVRPGAVGSRQTTPVVGAGRGWDKAAGDGMPLGTSNVTVNGHRPLSVGVAF